MGILDFLSSGQNGLGLLNGGTGMPLNLAPPPSFGDQASAGLQSFWNNRSNGIFPAMASGITGFQAGQAVPQMPNPSRPGQQQDPAQSAAAPQPAPLALIPPKPVDLRQIYAAQPTKGFY